MLHRQIPYSELKVKKKIEAWQLKFSAYKKTTRKEERFRVILMDSISS